MDSYQVWIQHFIDQSKGLVPHQSLFYKINNSSQKGEGKPTIQAVTPTEQVLARAKSSMEEQSKPSYDPVTGVFHQSLPNLLGRQKLGKLGARKKSSVNKLRSLRVGKKTSVSKVGKGVKKVTKKLEKKAGPRKNSGLKKSLKSKSKRAVKSWVL